MERIQPGIPGENFCGASFLGGIKKGIFVDSGAIFDSKSALLNSLRIEKWCFLAFSGTKLLNLGCRAFLSRFRLLTQPGLHEGNACFCVSNAVRS